MPFIYVHGIPTGLSGLDDLTTRIQKAAAGIEELGLKPDDFKIFLQADLRKIVQGAVIVTEVRCLFALPGRTQAVRQHLVETIRDVLHKYADDQLLPCALVAVSQRPFVDTTDVLDPSLVVGVYTSSNPQEK